MRCTRCGTEQPDTAAVCRVCGADFEPGVSAVAAPPDDAEAPLLPRTGRGGPSGGTPRPLPAPELGLLWALGLSPIAGGLAWARRWLRNGQHRAAWVTLGSGIGVTAAAVASAVAVRGLGGRLVALGLMWTWIVANFRWQRRASPARVTRPFVWVAAGVLAVAQLGGILGTARVEHYEARPAASPVPNALPHGQGTAAPPTGSAMRRPAAAVTAVSTVALTPAPSPWNDYTVGVPAGWTARPLSTDSDALELVSGAPLHQATVLILPGIAVSDLRFTAMLRQCTQAAAQNPITGPDVLSCTVRAGEAQLQDSSHAWTPQQAANAILEIVAPNGAYSGLQLPPFGARSALFRVTLRNQGQTVQSWGYLAVVPLANPLLSSSAGPGVTSVVLVGSCTAPPDQVAGLTALCGQVLGSFHAGRAFWNHLAQRLMQTYETEAQILLQMGHQAVANFAWRQQTIQQWGAAMLQMQVQTNAAEQAARQKIALNEIATLGGDTLEQDPNTGKVYSLPAGFAQYCINSTGDTAAMGGILDVKAGVDHCQTLLRPWQ
jgi:hypothetical protein